jgi:threonine/homoserine/homoserine lactone efflux protein
VFGTIIGLLSGRLGNTLRSRKWVTKLLDRISGTVLAGLGLRLALNDNRP